MDTIVWDSIYSVNHLVIDSHHKKLATIINSLKTSIEQSDSNGLDFHLLLNELFEFTRYHFNEEEKLFKATNYPKAVEHTDCHLTFISKMADVSMQACHNIADKEALHKFLVNWWKNHILVEDRTYIPYINQQLTTA